jgi:hypothetical protein
MLINEPVDPATTHHVIILLQVFLIVWSRSIANHIELVLYTALK